MTDAEIDGLSGRQLDEAVFRANGWTMRIDGNGLTRWFPPKTSDWRDHQGYLHLESMWRDVGKAMLLLLSHKGFIRICLGDGITVIAKDGSILAAGPKSDAASLICKSYLKLVNKGA